MNLKTPFAGNISWLVRLGLMVLLLTSAAALGRMGVLSIRLGWALLFSAVYLAATAGLAVWRRPDLRAAADYAHILLDILWIFAFIRAVGGAESPFSLLFFLTIIQAANVRFLRGAIGSAALSSLAFALLLVMEYKSWAAVQQGAGSAELMAAFRADFLFRGYVYAICFFVVAALSGILAERLRLKGRQLEAAARGWEEFRLSTGDILKKMGSGLLTVNANGQVRYCNRTGAEILGLAEDNIEGLQISEAFKGRNNAFGSILESTLRADLEPPDDESQSAQASKRRLTDVRRELILQREDGSEIPIGISTTTVRDAEGRVQGLIAIFQNLTEAKRIEGRLQQMEKLEAQNEHTHILLTMVQPMLAGIEQDIGRATERFSGAELEELSRDIGAKVESVRRVIEDFMRYARIEIPQERREDGGNPPSEEKAVIGRSRIFLKTMELVGQVAASDSTVLLQGESGTGKELLAREIHRLSKRRHGPFVTINCAALPEGLLESELFGHVRGSFTGAVRDKDGLFRAADGGTFFLDEVSETSPAIQVKLLRVLQEREIVPVGGSKPIKVDVRLISATNAVLADLVEKGRFRSDLFYRLNVIPISIPPLREREDDILLLAEHFIAKYCQKTGKPMMGFSERAEKALKSYRWPGNVRELENAMERAVVVSDSVKIELEDLPKNVQEAGKSQKQIPEIRAGEGTLREKEMESIVRALREEKGNKKLAAKRLGIHYATLYRKIKQYGLEG
jgi:two-component system response regulator HydG